MRRYARIRAVWLTTLAGVAGCTLHDVDTQPSAPLDVPAEFGSAPAGDGWDAASTRPWWESFGDPALDAAVRGAIDGNFDVRVAWARLEQASAVVGSAEAAWWPRISASTGATTTRSVFAFQGKPIVNKNDQFEVSVGLSYEVDLWGKVLSRAEAAELDAIASVDDARTAAMTVAANLVDAWYQQVEQRALLALLQQQSDINATYLQLVELRFAEGLASAVDVLQQRQQFETISTQVPLIEARLQVLEHLIAALSGRAPGAAAAAGAAELPELPPPPASGVPGDLLVRRPDVRAAHARIVAADHRVAAAVADYLPSLTLSASTGFRSFDITELFDSWVYALSASISQLVWDGGARGAEVERLEAVVRERLMQYGKTVVTAIREVEDASVQERQQRAQISRIDQQLTTARKALQQTVVRYKQGLSDYLPVLTALNSVQRLEQTSLSARRLLVSHRIQLYRALGGGWMEQLEPPKGPEAAQASSQATPTTAKPSSDGAASGASPAVAYPAAMSPAAISPGVISPAAASPASGPALAKEL